MGNLFSAETSTTASTQINEEKALQQISTGCNVGAIQSIDGLDITLSNVHLPQGFTISQVMTADPNCILKNGADALAKALQSSTVSAGAKKAALSLGILDIETARTMSFTQLSQTIQQKIESHCNINSAEDMHNVKIAIDNSTLASFNITQQMNQHAQCAIDTVTSANMEAQQSTTASTQAGGTDWKSLLMIGAVILVILVIAGVGIYFYMRSQKQGATQTPSPNASASPGYGYPPQGYPQYPPQGPYSAPSGYPQYPPQGYPSFPPPVPQYPPQGYPSQYPGAMSRPSAPARSSRSSRSMRSRSPGRTSRTGFSRMAGVSKPSPNMMRMARMAR